VLDIGQDLLIETANALHGAQRHVRPQQRLGLIALFLGGIFRAGASFESKDGEKRGLPFAGRSLPCSGFDILDEVHSLFTRSLALDSIVP
jgi:hypothetical protein